MGWRQMHAYLIGSLLPAMKMAGAEGKPDDYRVAADVEEHSRNGNDSGYTKRLNNMAKPVKVLVNVVPRDFHLCGYYKSRYDLQRMTPVGGVRNIRL